ncbi:MAG: hypothetical protein ACPGSM_16165 [Thiolinea sp.]
MNQTTHLIIRFLLVATGAFLLLLCGGFWMQQPDVLALWPWPDGRLSYIFIASILAAIGAPVIWMGISGELAGMRGGALDFAMTYLGLSVTLLAAGAVSKQWVSVPFFLILSTASLVFNLVLFFATRNLDFQDKRPVPWLVRASFLLFFVVLVLVGIALITRYTAVFPWPLQPQTSVVFGWIFLGAAVYFLYGLTQPYWGNFCGQLIGFLAYDLILLVPFLQHFGTVKAEHQLSLYVYTAVIIYSALLSLYFLFVHPQTRFGSRQQT